MNVLLISPNFFNYPKEICSELKKMGHKVDWFDDRPSTNSFVKAVIRINKSFISFYIKRYFKDMIKKIQNKKYDKVLIISGQSLSLSYEMIEELKIKQSQAEFILYQWDSLKNFPYIKTLKSLFNRCYSFDNNDVKLNEYLKFLPLFYTSLYENIGKEEKENYRYDVMFVGTAHPKKYKYISLMSKQLKEKFSKQYIYFFFPSKLVYIYRKLKNPEFKNAKFSDFNFNSLNEKQMIDLLKNSKCVLDSAQDGQDGLTIRVLETLGAKRKLITTNKNVKDYDFYCPENIYIYNGQFDFNDIFFNSNYRNIDEKIYRKYSLNSWLKILLGENNEF